MAKMFDRLLLFIYTFIIACSMIVLMFMTFGWIGYHFAENYLDNLYHEPLVRNSLLIVSIVFLFISVRLFYLAIRRNQTHSPSIDLPSTHGNVSISMDTVQNVALRASGKVKGLNELKARIQMKDSGLEIDLQTKIDGESPIPRITEDVQRIVKEQVELLTGIPVAKVSVYVANIVTASAPTFKSRVE
ncbi:MAG: alkaline shock response membrane anchor protein AmaP [Paenibacillaceae bacterium]